MESAQVASLYTGLIELEKQDRVGKLSLLRMANAPADVAEAYSNLLLGKVTEEYFKTVVDRANNRDSEG